MKPIPEWFLIGFRETKVGTIVNVEAFCEPHDDNLVAQIAPYAPHARMDEDLEKMEVQVRLSDLHMNVFGGFTNSRAEHWMETLGLFGAQQLKMRYTEADELEKGIRELIVKGLVPKSGIPLPLHIVTKEGLEDTRVILEEGQKPVILHANINVEGNDVVILVPTLPKAASFRTLGTELREEVARSAATETLNAHGLFTRT